MSTEQLIKHIRGQSAPALPSDDSYLFRLGVALYGFAYVANFMTEVAGYLDASDPNLRGNLQALEGGGILDGFRQANKKIKSSNAVTYNRGVETANLFEDLNTRRSDFIHAYPITNTKNEQALWRRHALKSKNLEINNQFLDDFIGDLRAVLDGLYEIRKAVAGI